MPTAKKQPKKRAAKKAAAKKSPPRQIDHIPSVFDQGFEVERIEGLTAGNGVRFNASSCQFRDKRYTAYRTMVEGMSKIAVRVEDADGQVLEDKVIEIAPHGSISSFIDPRLFVYKDGLWLSCAEKDLVTAPGFRTIVRCVKLGKSLNQSQDLRIPFGHNYKGHEKNWMFFEHEGELHFVYDLTKQQVVKVNPYGKPVQEWKGDALQWTMGFLRGGSPMIPYKGGYIGFYHSGTDHAWQLRRYGLGLVEIEGEPPFRIRRLSNPFMFGSRFDEFCGAGNGNCIFVSGIEQKEDGLVAVAGVNDTFNVRVTVPFEKVEELLLGVEKWLEGDSPCYKIVNRPVPTIYGKEMIGFPVKASGMGGRTYYAKTDDPILAASLDKLDHVSVLDKDDYEARKVLVDAKMHNPPNQLPSYLKRRISKLTEVS